MIVNKKIVSILLVVFTIGGSALYIYFTYIRTQPSEVTPILGLSPVDTSADTSNANPFSDPITSSPTDQTFNFTPATTTDIEDTENLTATDKFARDLFTQYTATRQNTDLTGDNANQFAQDYVNNAKLPEITAKQYAAKDLVVGPSNQDTLKNYRDAIQAVTTENWPTSNEIAIIQSATTDNDLSKLTGLAPIIKNYQGLVTGLTELAVPSTAVSLHIQLLNSISFYLETLKTIENTANDPLSGIVGLKMFSVSQQNMLSSFDTLRNFFNTNIQ